MIIGIRMYALPVCVVTVSRKNIPMLKEMERIRKKQI